MSIRSLADQTRQWWAEKPARDAEWELWATVPDLPHLRELVALFCEGKLSFTPGHAGPREEETEGNVGEALAHANRSGFLTTNSQNGGEGGWAGQWRSDVEGLADDATVERLRGLVAGTRLRMQAEPLRFFRQRGTVPNSHQKPDGSEYDRGNPVLSWRDIAFQFSGIPGEVLSQVTRLNYVQIVDPKWGPSTLLWDRLSVPDWDNPPPLAEEDRTMPAHIPPGREDLWRRQEESDARLARLDTELKAAEKKAADLATVLDRDDSIVEDADREVERLHDAYNREVAVNDRIYTERLAGLTSHIDHDPTAPICTDCKGTGGPPGCDALSACPTCRGWGREHREPIPVWHEESKQWINPATGRPVDLLADPPKPPPDKATPPAKGTASAPTATTPGVTMTSADTYSGLRARVQGIAARMPEHQGFLQQALADVDQDIAELSQINEDSNQAEIQEAIGLLMQAKDSIEQAIWMVGAAQASTEGAAAGLA